MKKKFTIFAALWMALIVFIPQQAMAQAPEELSYQAIIRDASNNPVMMSTVGMQISILQGSSSGTAVYVETQMPMTNANGLISIQIGTGTVVSGTFTSIDWGNGPYFIKSETDPAGGNSYTITGTNQLLSVPYALHANEAKSLTGATVSTTGDTLYLGTNSWVIIPGISVANLPVGTIAALYCDSATNMGTITAGYSAVGVSSNVPYSGGNGATHNGQTVSSTGVTGLTATASAGLFANGSGSLMYTITGMPSGSGTASFALSIGGQICTLNITVVPDPYPSGTVFCASGPTAVMDVTNPATGKTWMDRNMGATQVASSSTDMTSYGDLFQWGRAADGHQCRDSDTLNVLSASDQPGHAFFILTGGAPNNWRSPENASLWQGVSGTNNPCPSGYRLPTDAELDNERMSWSSNSAAGAFGSPLKLTAAGRRGFGSGTINNVGIVGSYWSSTINGTNANGLYFNAGGSSVNSIARAIAGSVRCLKHEIESIDCGSAVNNGTLTSGYVASGVSSDVPYTGGIGGSHNGQTVTSTGVTGLTATLSAGSFANGSGSLTYTISGTPSNVGTASFALNIGGQSCDLDLTVSDPYPSSSVFCASGAADVVAVTNPTTGRTWMDRNLGASQVASSSTDMDSYGDLFQWGRAADGHQCRNSDTLNVLSASDQPGHAFFILTGGAPNNWRSPENVNLWQGVNGTNNPCPTGFRLPTDTELDNERLSWSMNAAAGAFGSPLKLPAAGRRGFGSGTINNVGIVGSYWSSTISGTNANGLYFNAGGSSINSIARAIAGSVRCTQD